MAYRETAECACGSVYCYDREKTKNVRSFWYYVVAFVAVCMAFFLMGSCLGCEACFECGACVDQSCGDCMGCSLEECGRECYREGSCYDCQYDSIVFEYPNGATYDLDDVKEEQKDFYQYYWKSGGIYSDTYFTPVGMYGEDGTLFVDASGKLKKDLDKTNTLYVKYTEKDSGQPYTIYFGDADLALDPMAVVVGEPMESSYLPERPVSDGVVCTGWSYNGNRVFSYDQNGNISVGEFHLYNFGKEPGSSDKTIQLEPIWEEVTYVVTFTLKNNAYASYQLKYGSSLESVWNDIATISQETLSSYGLNATFLYWADENGTQLDVDSYKVKGDKTFKAVIEEYVNIRFYYNDGTEEYVDKQAIVGAYFNDFPTVDADRRAGYRFVAWYANAEGTGDPTYSLQVEGATSLYGGWEPVVYKIEYYEKNTNGYEAYPSRTYNYGDSFDLYGINPDNPNETITEYGYNFIGWRLGDENGDPTGAVITKLTADMFGDLKFIATYEAKTFTIQLQSVLGGTFSPNQVSVTYGENFTLPVPQYSTNRDFAYWYYQSQGSSTPWTDINGNSTMVFTFKNLGISTSGNFDETQYQTVTFNDYTTLKKVKVTFCDDSGTPYDETGNWKPQLVIPNTQAAKPTLNPTKTGYTFVAWYTDKVGGEVFDFNTKINGDITLYARFQACTTVVLLNANGGKYGDFTTVKTVEIDYDTPIDDPSATWETPTLTDFNFLGYETEDGVLVTDGTGKLLKPFDLLGETVSLKAVWERAVYTIVLDADNGDGDVVIKWTRDSSLTYIDYNDQDQEMITLPIKLYEDNGNEMYFVGWYDKKIGGVPYFDRNGFMPGVNEEKLFALADENGTIRLYAIWQ